MARIQSPDATRSQLSTAAASATRDKLRGTPRIQGSGPASAQQHDRTLAGRAPVPAPGASNANRPRLKMPGGDNAA